MQSPQSDHHPEVMQPGEPSPAGVKRGGAFSGGLGLVVAVVLFGVAAFLIYRTFTSPEQEPWQPVYATFMCVETGQTFRHAMSPGEKWPIMSPFTDKTTAYPTEQCYWTKDGKRKKEPTYVVLNEHLGKPGDTICPDCGRLVVGHNEPPPADTPLADEPSGSPTTKPSMEPTGPSDQ